MHFFFDIVKLRQIVIDQCDQSYKIFSNIHL